MQQILPLPRICCCCSTLCGRQSVYPGSRSIREAIICCYCTFSGAIILLGYTAFDSFISNWQSELFSLYKMSTIQMMFGADLFSCLFTGWPSTIEGGNFLSAVGFMMSHPEFAYHATILSLASATEQVFNFYTIQSFGPVVFTIIMTIRMMLSIMLSCIIYNHPLSAQAVLLCLLHCLACVCKVSCKLPSTKG